MISSGESLGALLRDCRGAGERVARLGEGMYSGAGDADLGVGAFAVLGREDDEATLVPDW